MDSLRPGLSRGDLKEERPDMERRNVPVKFSVQKSCGVPVHAERRYRSPCAEDGLVQLAPADRYNQNHLLSHPQQ